MQSMTKIFNRRNTRSYTPLLQDPETQEQTVLVERLNENLDIGLVAMRYLEHKHQQQAYSKQARTQTINSIALALGASVDHSFMLPTLMSQDTSRPRQASQTSQDLKRLYRGALQKVFDPSSLQEIRKLPHSLDGWQRLKMILETNGMSSAAVDMMIEEYQPSSATTHHAAIRV